MGKQHSPHHCHIHKSHTSRTNLASCILATVFLILILTIASILYFTLFRPRDPKLTVNSIQIPAFSTVNSTVDFTFSQYVTVNNPNRAVFTHYDSTLQLLYAGNQVGFMFIPSGKIGPGKTQYMAATFSVKSFPVPGPPENVVPDVNGFRVRSSMEVETRLDMAGRIRVLHFFTHHLEAKANCRVAVGVTDGSVLGFHC